MATDLATPDESVLGAAIRQARQARHISVREMARRLECTPGHVSQMERGLSSPSVAMLFRVLAVLGLSLDELVGDSRSFDPIPNGSETRCAAEVVRRERHRSIRIKDGIEWQLLTPALEQGFEFTMYTYDVGASDGEEFLRREGREYGLVLSGRIGCGVAFEEHVLVPGDTVVLDGMKPHRFWNAGDVPAQLVWIVRSV